MSSIASNQEEGERLVGNYGASSRGAEYGSRYKVLVRMERMGGRRVGYNERGRGVSENDEEM
ncbi:hypothetical protein E2C01_092501 [Portunus trituberculatus]|uniref:Uncharacterized protein n=1 Tax=Portunus trituberculatus TaxID=210409 RepID=A0A5B7JK93_PORTR|nr:hypothetical protein [Portunus trituberculatus]